LWLGEPSTEETWPKWEESIHLNHLCAGILLPTLREPPNPEFTNEQSYTRGILTIRSPPYQTSLAQYPTPTILVRNVTQQYLHSATDAFSTSRMISNHNRSSGRRFTDTRSAQRTSAGKKSSSNYSCLTPSYLTHPSIFPQRLHDLLHNVHVYKSPPFPLTDSLRDSSCPKQTPSLGNTPSLKPNPNSCVPLLSTARKPKTLFILPYSNKLAFMIK
jgi:hypothetical protein